MKSRFLLYSLVVTALFCSCASNDQRKKFYNADINVIPFYCSQKEQKIEFDNMIYSFVTDSLVFGILENENQKRIFTISDINLCTLFSNYLINENDEVLFRLSIQVSNNKVSKNNYYFEKRELKNQQVILTNKGSFFYSPDFVNDKEKSIWHKLNNINIEYNSELDEKYKNREYVLSFLLRK